MGSSDKELTGIIEDIRSAEEKAEKIKEDAKKEAENEVKRGKEEAARVQGKTEEMIVSKKNKLLETGVAKIEEKVNATLSEAKKEASKLKKKSLNQKDFNSLFDRIIQ